MSEEELEKNVAYLKKKLAKIDELESLDIESEEFQQWQSTLITFGDRLGATYKQRLNSLDFSPNVMGWGQHYDPRDREHLQAYRAGLRHARAVFNGIIEELEELGPTSTAKPQASRPSTTLNLTITQNQVVEIAQEIGLSKYPEDIQAKVNELLTELKKPDKNIEKIKPILSLLVEKATPVLISMLLARLGLPST
jgi:hypothetical protein